MILSINPLHSLNFARVPAVSIVLDEKVFFVICDAIPRCLIFPFVLVANAQEGALSALNLIKARQRIT